MKSTIDNPLHKVAILVASLDEDSSERILASLSAEQEASVRRQVESLEAIDPDEQRAIVAEFRRSLPQNTSSRMDGVELEISPEFRATNEEFAPPSQAGSRPPQGGLADMDTAFIAQMLKGEHPQTIALVMTRLETKQAVEVLGKFSTAEQADVMQRLAELDTIDEEALQVVEAQVTQWISQQQQRKQRMSAGRGLVEQLLKQTPASQREAVIAAFSVKHPELAGSLSKSSSAPAEAAVAYRVSRGSEPGAGKVSPNGKTEDASLGSRDRNRAEPPKPRATEQALAAKPHPFAGHSSEECLTALETLDSQTLLAALAGCGPEVVSLALVGASEKLLKRVLSGLSRREARAFRQSLRERGPTRISDILAALQELLRCATELTP